MRYTQDDGTPIWTHVTAVPILGDEGQITGQVSVVTDTDALKGAEEAMRQSEARFRSLATVGSSSVYFMSPDWGEMRRLDGAGFLVNTQEPTSNWIDTYTPPDERLRVRQAIERAITVYTIVVIMAPYKLSSRTHEVVRDEVLISTLNPRNLKGVERNLFNHELIYLNPNYRDAATPQNYRDWLDLIYESIHRPVSPEINIANERIRHAAELIE